MFALLLTQVHFSMASDPLQLLRGANRPTKSMMPYYVDAVPVEEAFTKHVPPFAGFHRRDFHGSAEGPPSATGCLQGEYAAVGAGVAYGFIHFLTATGSLSTPRATT